MFMLAIRIDSGRVLRLAIVQLLQLILNMPAFFTTTMSIVKQTGRRTYPASIRPDPAARLP
jgi:hypothetical protein